MHVQLAVPPRLRSCHLSARPRASTAACLPSSPPLAQKCKEAIDKGLERFQAKDLQGAIDLFNLALELPGNGAYRLPTSPREFRRARVEWGCAHPVWLCPRLGGVPGEPGAQEEEARAGAPSLPPKGGHALSPPKGGHALPSQGNPPKPALCLDTTTNRSCPSDAEENAALYNMACAYAQLGQMASAVTCLEAVLENGGCAMRLRSLCGRGPKTNAAHETTSCSREALGSKRRAFSCLEKIRWLPPCVPHVLPLPGFKDYAAIRSDPDLAPLGKEKLEALVSEYENPLSQVRGDEVPGVRARAGGAQAAAGTVFC